MNRIASREGLDLLKALIGDEAATLVRRASIVIEVGEPIRVTVDRYVNVDGIDRAAIVCLDYEVVPRNVTALSDDVQTYARVP